MSERALWLSVIAQALTDATCDLSLYKSVSTYSRAEQDKRMALAWLRSGNDHFRYVCSLAGVEPYDVLRLVSQMIASKEQPPARPKPTSEARRERNKLYEFDGKRMSLKQWSEHVGISHQTLYSRLHMGWGIERALTERLHPTNYHKTGAGRCSSIRATNTRLFRDREGGSAHSHGIMTIDAVILP